MKQYCANAFDYGSGFDCWCHDPSIYVAANYLAYRKNWRDDRKNNTKKQQPTANTLVFGNFLNHGEFVANIRPALDDF